MIIHIDMDAFFSSVEQRDNPELLGKCVIVGKDSKRGIVSTASYEARKFGIHSAMPIYKAKKKCPDAVIIHPRKERYKKVSTQIMEVLNRFSPLVEPASIDEAYLDISGMERLYGEPEELAKKIKKEIKHRVNLTCSVGIAPNKFLAKIASDMEKPNSLTFIKPEHALSFARFLPVQKVPGIGEKAKKYFDEIGIKILGDILKISDVALSAKFGKSARRLIELANCIDKSPVIPYTLRKSVSVEETLNENTYDRKMLLKYLLQHSEDVGKQLRKSNLVGRNITIKIKHSNFKQATRSKTLVSPTSSSNTIFKEAKKLFYAYQINKSIRLIGIKVSCLVYDKMPFQRELFDNVNCNRENWGKVEKAIDQIFAKFGKDIVKRASLNML
mmetsp:Transcript_246/g.88  ORF Transcript_246/g.88 Transcript_246/m.88 type:complete len:386 (-) Transcript_246:209-1366(-)